MNGPQNIHPLPWSRDCSESAMPVTDPELYKTFPPPQYLQRQDQDLSTPPNLSCHVLSSPPSELYSGDFLMADTYGEESEPSTQVDDSWLPNMSVGKAGHDKVGTSPRDNPSLRNCVEVEETPQIRAHYAVEKRYRANLNEKIAMLDRLISKTAPLPEPTSMMTQDDNERTGEASNSASDKPCTKVRRQNKTAVLSKAIQYIQDLQNDAKKLRRHVDELNCRAAEAKKLLNRGSEDP